mmetsp:Transcript_84872/g.240509  ORF Transcript_84872/g.240509 Transcript_84872/m.240509 type:complete len:380 (+) Transcript_84872:60-1199(+)
MGDEEELEYTLLNKRDVLVYQIPPASSSAGHKADDWKKCIWRGRCRIVGKGQDLSIKLLDASSGQLFAQCTVPKGDHPQYVERVIDSSRYFVLKIANGQRHAFIGLGFEDRNDAFDFSCTLNDFKSTFVDKEAEIAPQDSSPARDLSLKEGQKITIKINGMEGRTRRREDPPADAGAGFAGILAPPPSSGAASRRSAQQAAAPLQPPPGAKAPAFPQPTAPQAVATIGAAPAGAPAQDDPFGDFADFQAAPAPPADAAAPAVAGPSMRAPPTAAPAPVPAAQPVADMGFQFDQLSLGSAQSQPQAGPSLAAPAQMPMHSHQPAAPAPQATQPPVLASGPQDMFSGIAALAPAAAPPPQQVLPRQGAGRRDPFDEFDIFK